jgi:two-component system, sensor histidine kinase LadS
VRALFAAVFLLCLGALAAVAHAGTAQVEVLSLDRSIANPKPEVVTGGTLDEHFAKRARGARGVSRDYWLKLNLTDYSQLEGMPVIVAHATRDLHLSLLISRDGAPAALPLATTLSGFLGIRDGVYPLPGGYSGQALYAHITTDSDGAQSLSFSASTLESTLAEGETRARMIALAFGALAAVSLAGLLIWFVLKDRLFILYATLFSLQALYIGYLSGQAFDWPWLSVAAPWGSFAWNIPVALSGAAACLFTREIADLKRSSPRVYKVFGWFALAFVVLAFANVAKFYGLEPWVNDAGNVVFLSSAIFTLVVCFLAWRRGNRAAGWFLAAWTLLEGFTIAAAVGFLVTTRNDALELYYVGLPLSMVAASILIALGVADRLRAQRVALSEAERRAQIDPLTGVLNRRSLIERLDAACQRAQARGLPIALLFIDLDYFKLINDSFGHPAGDACLRAIIPPIHAELRQSDVIGRYGGEEFVVILSSADATAAIPIAQRILERVAEVRVDGFGSPIKLTCSIGIATSDTLGVWGEHLIARADAAVYVAKRSGRNQVQVARNLAA